MSAGRLPDDGCLLSTVHAETEQYIAISACVSCDWFKPCASVCAGCKHVSAINVCTVNDFAYLVCVVSGFSWKYASRLVGALVENSSKYHDISTS